MRALLLILALTACTRPITPAESDLLTPIHGPEVPQGMWLARTPLVGLFPITYDARPPVACRERIVPPQTGRITARTGGIALFETLLVNPSSWRDDYAEGPPLDLAAAMFLAHEATHVWQWQNRARTGYHPAKAFAEQATVDDPYLFDAELTRPFLSYGYEVQASLVEEYVCCATLDPAGDRTERLHALLSEALPVAPPHAFAREVVLPWAGARIEDICA
ncbi:hypothetical protein MWU52_01015 [Jannaschia sp. S6380]|uniref:hypothetical protein n=1 Tax=Jannaschia sp. S6380 TaxID=2926408 RepID=UPI001FF2E3BE|nr:hypothetical protein [Jannaschia sp. S6380]MCK0166123.1 hypothetical protein [Jannaschia sp. S6380]